MGLNGYVYMINNINFEHLNNRNGSEKDEEKIEEFFKNTVLWKDVHIERDLKVDEMKQKINELSEKDFTENGALFLFVSSHGNENVIAGTNTKKFNNVISPRFEIRQDILSLFIRDNFKSEKSIPKFFIFEMCRDVEKSTSSKCKDHDILQKEDQKSLSPDEDVTVYSIFNENDRRYKNFKKDYNDHNESNFFVWYATVHGEQAKLEEDKGSYFLQAMMKTFTECHKTKSVPQMVAIVNREMIKQSNGERTSQLVYSPLVEPYFPEYFK